MKKLYFILIPALLFSIGCTKNLTSLNVDPKSPIVVLPTGLFLNGEKNFVDSYTSTSVAAAPFRVLAQEWTENTYTYEAVYNFAAYQAPDRWWGNLYGQAAVVAGQNQSVSVLSNIDIAKNLFATNTADPVITKNNVAICNLMEIYSYYLLVATYGDIPYSQALNQSIPFPAYDDQKVVYSSLLARLDSSIANLTTSSVAMGASDQIYLGKVASWIKFAATLKLKMALLIADVDPTTAGKKVTEAVATGVFSSNSDNALLKYDPSSTTTSNPLWQALAHSGRHDFDPAALLVNTMQGLNDPRVPLYFTPNTSGAYVGAIPGQGNGYGDPFSDFTPIIQAAQYPGDILDYPETEFLLAEAAARGFTVPGTAESHYNNAITASIQFWGGSASAAATYLAQPSVAYTTAAGPWQQKIGIQTWIAFYNRNWDAWTIIRRLGYPQIDVVSPPVGAKGKFPLRFTYPTTEQTSNAVNYNKVLAKMGGTDVVSTKLFWMK